MTIVFGSEADNWGNTDPSMSTLRWMELTCEQDLTCTSNSLCSPHFFLRVSLSLHPSLLLGFSPGPIFRRTLLG